MDTRCQVCLQQATRKCTACGQVFCDLHVRYGGQAGGMYGADDVGYYCDACWESRVSGRRRTAYAIVVLGLAVLVAGGLGVFVMRGSDVPPISATIWVVGAILAFAVILGIKVMFRRR